MRKVTPMDSEAPTANRMGELPEKTKQFLSKMDDDDVEVLEDLIKIYSLARSMGHLVKWLCVTILAIVLGFASLYENGLKLWSWFHK